LQETVPSCILLSAAQLTGLKKQLYIDDAKKEEKKVYGEYQETKKN